MSRWTSFFEWAWPRPVAELSEEPEGLVAIQRPAAAVQPVRQRATLDVLHDDVRSVVVLADVEDLDDVRVIQPSSQPSLAREALPHLVVTGEVVGQELDRDLAVELQVAGAIDGGHAAMAQSMLELVALAREPALHPSSPLIFAWPGGTNPP